MRTLAALAVSGVVLVAGCGDGTTTRGAGASRPPDPRAPHTISVTSPAFEDGGAIPDTYTCHGAGTSPPLHWSGVDKERIGSVALVVDDPDAPRGDYFHWIVLGISTFTRGLKEGEVPDDAQELAASGGSGWNPPCPPSGTHHYRFTVYAFSADQVFTMPRSSSLEAMISSLAEHAAAWGRLTGTVTAN